MGMMELMNLTYKIMAIQQQKMYLLNRYRYVGGHCTPQCTLHASYSALFVTFEMLIQSWVARQHRIIYLTSSSQPPGGMKPSQV